MNEEGVEAAAAVAEKPVKLRGPPSFKVDHPFLFFIVSETEYPIFMGHVVKPEYQS